jgi:DNA end-binding protein Ku
MARAIWRGSVSFGLVTIPVRLFSAVSRKTVQFNQIDSKTGARVKQLRVSAADGREVSYDQIVKGYEVAPDTYLTVSDDELAALDPEQSRVIDVLEFVDLDEIDPVYFDSAYWLVPDEMAAKAYKLLTEALETSGKVAIARFVMRTKQYLAAIRARDGALTMSTMVYDDEVIDASQVEGLDVLDGIEVSDKERAMATQLIESLTEDFDASTHRDTYREAVLELLERKRNGEETVTALPEVDTEDRVVDLMAALQASVDAAKKSKKQHPSASPDEAEGLATSKRKRKSA